MLNQIFFILKKLKPHWLAIPTHCVLCLTSIKKQNVALCQGCKNDLPKILLGCQYCNLPLLYNGICGQCLQSPPKFFQAITPYRYDFPIAQLITQFKHQQQWPMGYVLSALLAEHLSISYQQGLIKPNYLVSVPMAKQRLRQRYFNQTEMMVKWLSKILCIDYRTDIIKRDIDTPPQQQLTAKERYRNLTHAFSINPQTNLTNLHLAIVDDVITTGSTANILAALCISMELSALTFMLSPERHTVSNNPNFVINLPIIYTIIYNYFLITVEKL